MDGTVAWWLGLVLGVLPLLLWVLWSWNEHRFIAPLKVKARSSAVKFPPGHMGLPFLGEMLTFLRYFKIVRRPDDFINSKRERYGDGAGMYRTHLFGSPSIIVCSPAFNKFVLQSDDLFSPGWPSVELVGENSLGAVNGKPHTRLRSYVYNSITGPEALRKITHIVQPRIVSSFQSWAEKGQVKGLNVVKKLTSENIGKIFVSLEPGFILDTLDQYIIGLVRGLRAKPFNFPGTAHHHALQCRKKLTSIFKKELQKKDSGSGSEERNDLMDGLMKMRDEEGKQLGDKEVLDNIVSLVIAGYESTSLASMWALYYLAKFPDVLRRLREENMAVSRTKKGDFITREDLTQLKYTNKVVEETLRMANISPFLFRVVNKDIDYQGYKIPKNWRMLVWIRHLHTDPNNFENPMYFNPDRWNALLFRWGSISRETRGIFFGGYGFQEPAKPGTFQVFGGGPRICPGNMLARLQLAIFLRHLAIGYKWELINPDAKITYLPFPKPVDGVEIKFSSI